MQQEGAGYGVSGMAQVSPYPSYIPPNPATNPINPIPSQYAPGYTYSQNSPILTSNSSDYASSYPGNYAAHSNLPENPAFYTPEPSDSSKYIPDSSRYASCDPSYSPRAPSFDRLPSHERSSFEPASYGYSYGAMGYGGGGYVPATVPNTTLDSYGSTEYNPSRWGYEQQDIPPTSDTKYGGFSYMDTPKPQNETDYSGAYAYEGGNTQPYGSRGTSSTRWTSENFNPLGDLPKLAKALPKMESESKGGGVQKYHVKLLQDSSSVGLPTNIICQIGLDGVRLVDPSSNRNLRIYPLDTITKWEVNEPSVFTFWAKSAVDFEQRRTRLQSSAATTNAILDTLTAACVQLCEMGGDENSAKASSTTTSITEAQKKASFADWLIRKPAPQEEKEHWVPDEAVTKCTFCASDFGPFLRRHHCRNCGDIFCDKCTRGRIALTSDEDAQPVRVCDRCLAEVTQRLTNAKESSTKLSVQQTHEDLAKKLQEEMERNAPRKSTVESDKSSSKSGGQTSLLNCSKCGSISIVSGSSTRCPSCGGSDSSGSRNGVTKKTSRFSETSRRRTREVACPTCTVHLEVEVPNYGSETVECGVCQHPFMVSA